MFSRENDGFRFQTQDVNTSMNAVAFQCARPSWLRGRETEMNLTVGFRAAFEAAGVTGARLRIAGSSFYRIWLNGCFLGYGPARAAHGFYRVDEWPLTLEAGANLLAVPDRPRRENSGNRAARPPGRTLPGPYPRG
jgi:hypothetical protein